MKIVRLNNSKLSSIRSSVLSNENDYWSLGILFLELALVENVHADIYDWNELSINFSLLRDKICQVESKYPLLQEILSVLLSITPKNRLRSH